MQRAASPVGSSHAMRAIVALWGLAAVSDCIAAGMDFLSDLPASYFTQEDRDMMMKNVKEILDSDDPKSSREWSNPKTGNSGSMKLRSQFTATDGAPCKRISVSSLVKAGSVKNAGTYVMCKYESRGWLLHPDAVPAPASPK
jgi:hypothetical protein